MDSFWIVLLLPRQAKESLGEEGEVWMNLQVFAGWARREFQEFGCWESFGALDWLGCLVRLVVLLVRQSGGL
jgi:hypothetical protein